MTTLAWGTGLLFTQPDSTWIRGTDSPLILWIPPNTKLNHSGGLCLSLQYSIHLGGHGYGTDTQLLSHGSNSAFARTVRRTWCPRGPLTFTVLAVIRTEMDTLPGLRGSWICCSGGTLHLLQSDRPLLSGLLQISPTPSCWTQPGPCRRHLIPPGHWCPSAYLAMASRGSLPTAWLRHRCLFKHLRKEHHYISTSPAAPSSL